MEEYNTNVQALTSLVKNTKDKTQKLIFSNALKELKKQHSQAKKYKAQLDREDKRR